MKPGKYNIEIYQGSTFSQVFRITDLDLTGYTFKMQIRKKVNGELLNELSTENQKIEVSSSDSFLLTIPAEETAILENGVYDIDMKKDGVVTTILAGNVNITKEVTV